MLLETNGTAADWFTYGYYDNIERTLGGLVVAVLELLLLLQLSVVLLVPLTWFALLLTLLRRAVYGEVILGCWFRIAILIGFYVGIIEQPG